jgi:hypothetical protein
MALHQRNFTQMLTLISLGRLSQSPCQQISAAALRITEVNSLVLDTLISICNNIKNALKFISFKAFEETEFKAVF